MKDKNQFRRFNVVPENSLLRRSFAVETHPLGGWYGNPYGLREKDFLLKELDKTPKNVYIVPAQILIEISIYQNGMIDRNEISSILKEYGLKLCVNSSNYLIGITAHLQEEETPQTISAKKLVALEPNDNLELLAMKLYTAGNRYSECGLRTIVRTHWGLELQSTKADDDLEYDYKLGYDELILAEEI